MTTQNMGEDLVVLVQNVFAARRQLEAAERALMDRVQIRIDESGALATPTDPILTLRQVADVLKCSTQKLRRGWKRGRYPFMFREGGRLLARRQDLEKWLSTCVKRSGN